MTGYTGPAIVGVDCGASHEVAVVLVAVDEAGVLRVVRAYEDFRSRIKTAQDEMRRLVDSLARKWLLESLLPTLERRDLEEWRTSKWRVAREVHLGSTPHSRALLALANYAAVHPP